MVTKKPKVPRKSEVWMITALIIAVGGFVYGLAINNDPLAVGCLFTGFLMIALGLPFWMVTGGAKQTW